MSTFSVELLEGDRAAMAVPALAEVLIDCVDGGASVSFMAPLSREKADTFWRRVVVDVGRGEAALLVARNGGGEIVGTVQLRTGVPENQPHRGDVAKLLVERQARRQGIAEALMREVELLARQVGKTLLVLDTVTGSDAWRLYRRLGWQICGTIPNYALYPDGRACPTTVFWKALGV